MIVSLLPLVSSSEKGGAWAMSNAVPVNSDQWPGVDLFFF